MTFFFDRNISANLVHMLSHYDRANTIIHQDDDNRFVHNDSDTHLIATVSQDLPRTVFVTSDISQRRNPAERAALAGSKMHVIFFRRFNKAPRTQAFRLLAVWDGVAAGCTTARVPTVFEVSGDAPLVSEKFDRRGPTADLAR